MNNARRMTDSERAAIEIIASNIFAELARINNQLFTDSPTNKKAFVEGFVAGREYTLDQMEDLIEDMEIQE